MANLPPVEYDAALSDGAEKHARYLLANRVQAYHWDVSNDRLGAGQLTFAGREESPGKPGYSEEGRTAAKNATIFAGRSLPTNFAAIIDQLIAMPFSSLSVLHPQLRAMGLGTACEPNDCVGVAALKHGLPKQEFVRLYDDPAAARWNPALGDIPVSVARLREPIRFPPDGGTAEVLQYDGNGTLDALGSCDGYRAPAGAPIILMLGRASERDGTVRAAEHSLTNSTGAVAHCVIDAATYSNSDKQLQEYGRRWLNSVGAVVLIPRDPFAPGERYRVSIRADGRTHAWSFATGSAQTPRSPRADPAGEQSEPPATAADSEERVWLARLNYWRRLAGLEPVEEDMALSRANREHARYIAKNRDSTHRQDPASPHFSAAGERSARRSNVSMSFGASARTPADMIDNWMEAPFHRLPMLNPDLRVVGFGFFRDGDVAGAALDVQSAPPPRRPLARPIMFPPPNSTVGLYLLEREQPSPLTSCAGYKEPSGLPITLQLGYGIPTTPSAHSLRRGAKAIEHCLFDGDTYANPDPAQQQLVRDILKRFGAVVVVPREVLRPGTPYQVSLTVGGETYAWSFAVGESAQASSR
jgi:uncharacterized protein YkwD